MQKSSMRRNITVVAGLYAISFVVAAGCPATNGSKPSEPASAQPVVPAVGNASENSQHKVVVVANDAAEHATATAHETKKDPVQQHVEFFVGWKKPKLAIVISGRQDGYLEPCGCSGLENQKGGLGRRYSLIEQLKEKGWPLIAVDVGNYVRRFGKQAEIQFAISVEALKGMGYQAATFGTDDLRLSSGEIAAAVAGPDGTSSLFLSANADLFGLVSKSRIVEENGMKVGITAVLGETYRKQVNNAEIEIKPAADALREVVGDLAKCDVRILLAHTTQEEATELAKTFPDFDYVVCSEGGDEPPYQPKSIEGTKTKLIEVGHKGMYCVVIGLFDDKDEPFRYQRVAIDSRYPTAPAMKQLMATYQDQLRELGWAGLGLRPIAHPRMKEGVEDSGKFVGAETCKDCHTKAWDVWSKTGHAHATDTLVKADPPRQFDAECISCHAVGWNPQDYFQYSGGFESIERTPHLTGNQCENCHGPGGAHVAAEMSEQPDRDEQRELMRLTLAEAKENFCVTCHDLDNSPKFVTEPGAFEKYWKQIEHYGKD
jgi:hypothetical protein